MHQSDSARTAILKGLQMVKVENNAYMALFLNLCLIEFYYSEQQYQTRSTCFLDVLYQQVSTIKLQALSARSILRRHSAWLKGFSFLP